MIILPSKTLLSSLVVAALLTGCGDSKESANPVVAEFSPVEGTIAQLHAALTAGTTSCEAVVQQYIDRIAAYDRTGPTLNSVISVSDEALTTARAQDEALAAGESMQPLQCVTVLLKDNIDTADMPTSAGGLALQHSQPEDDAYIVKRLREQGAIILGKANLDEFAFGYQGSSSVGGQVKNAYDQTKGPGGSSAGTGAAIAASFAMVGLGTDTGGSIRVPSSLEGLVGLRPSLRLVSQDGVVPLAHTQDTAGPMCRTVEDCALVMDALVGYDSASDSGQRNSYEYDAPLVASAYEYQQVTGVPASYASGLSATALKGAHIGVVRALFGDGESEENQAVQAVLDSALAKMTAAGALVEEVTIPNLDTILSTYKSVSRYEFCNDLTSYLSAWSNELDGHYTSFQAVADMIERPIVVRGALMQALENLSEAGVSQGEPFDALVYPSILGLAPALGFSPTSGSNNRLSPFSGFPALTLPAGMADTEPALPVGIELLGREFDEQTLLNLAYGFEQVAQPRQAPTFTPAL